MSYCLFFILSSLLKVISTGPVYQHLPDTDFAESSAGNSCDETIVEEPDILSIWKQQFFDALVVLFFPLLFFSSTINP